MSSSLYEKTNAINALLPQTQCRQCGQPGCRPYAEAVATGTADINQCPPGGDEVAAELASLLGIAAKPLNTRFGIHKPPAAAFIDESLCIGCTLCICACPVDAIVGAKGHMHTIVTRDCTGCELCMPPCPVACIAMKALPGPAGRDERRPGAAHFRARFERRSARLRRRPPSKRAADSKQIKATVQRAIERARLRLAQRKSS